MSESNNQRSTRRRTERAQQLYNARTLPDAEDTASYQTPSPEERPAARLPIYAQPLTAPAKLTAPGKLAPSHSYDETRFTPNEATAPNAPVRVASPTAAPAKVPAPLPPDPAAAEDEHWADALSFDGKETAPEPADAKEEPSPERSALAANLSAYYRRAANVSAQEHTDPFTPLEWPPKGSDAPEVEEDTTANVNVYRMQEASWAQEERQSMLTGKDADGYQVQTEERRPPVKRKRKKHLWRNVGIGVAVAAVAFLALAALLGEKEPESIQSSGGFTPVVTTTPQPIRGYDAAPAIAVSSTTSEAIDQISGPVEMATCAVTEGNVLTRSMRADGLYDYYLFASDGRLLAYFDKQSQDGMFPMKDGGFYVDMEPWLVDEEGHAMIALAGLEETIGNKLILRPLMNGWAQAIASDGESNLINRDGQLLSRLWFSRSFPMTGTESVAYVDTGVEGSPTRYTLYVLDGTGAGNTVKWQDAADEEGVVACALGMVYLQNGELYRLSQLLEDPAAPPLCITSDVRFYTDCNAMVVQDAASGKYALYVNGECHYDFIYDSILPVESDVRWQGDVLAGAAGQATVLAVSGASYPQPLSHYFELSRSTSKEYVALSAVTNCPILLD